MFLRQIISGRIIKFKADEKVLLKLYVDHLKKIDPSDAAETLMNIDYADAAKILKALKDDALLKTIMNHMLEESVYILNVLLSTTTALRNDFNHELTPLKGILKNTTKEKSKKKVQFEPAEI